MNKLISKINKSIERWGNDFCVTTKFGTAYSRAIIFPLRYKNKLYVELYPSEVGKIDDGCCMYLGPANVFFNADDIVTYQGKNYVTQRFEEIFIMKEIAYCWAVLRPCVSEGV